MTPEPGDVWLADLGSVAKTRPIVIVSRRDFDPPRALVLYVALTTQRRPSPYEVPVPRLPYLDRDSVANVQGLGSLPTARLNTQTWQDSEGRVHEDQDRNSVRARS